MIRSEPLKTAKSNCGKFFRILDIAVGEAAQTMEESDNNEIGLICRGVKEEEHFKPLIL